MKLLTLILLTYPLSAQINGIFPPTPINIGETMSMVIPPQSNNVIPARPYGTPNTDESRIPGRSLYRWSIATVIAANGADVISSWRMGEANPVVAGPGNRFGVSSMLIKSGFVGGSLLIQQLVLRHRPDLYRKLAWMNFATSGVLGGAAAYNTSIR